jgi:crotonobetainyl-CoA:carnitine CoA-transferase CaiB-like acyl-CoA transferase
LSSSGEAVGETAAGGPFAGLKVVELGVWVAAPSAGGLLSDWGAEVIKIEPLAGDPFRGIQRVYGAEINAPFELDNRGKRSIGLDLGTEDGRRIARELALEADVFVTNMRVQALQRWGLDHESLSAEQPRLVYGLITGQGREGPDADRAAYDVGAYWARSGMVSALMRPGQAPVQQRGGMGDHSTGMTLTAGISAALFRRERTGTGQLVETSLLRTGLYVLGWDTSVALRTGAELPQGTDRTVAGNPVFNSYQDSEGRWFWLLGLEADRHWPKVCRAVGRPEWIEEPRFESYASRVQHAAEIVEALDAEFRKAPLAEWTARFGEHDVWWAPVRSSSEVLEDPQVAASGAVVEVQGDAPDAGVRVLASPVDFSQDAWQVRALSPELGEHTESVLLERGYTWEQLAELKDRRAIY